MSTNQFAPGCCCGLPFSGTAIHCLGAGFAGDTVEIKDHGTLATLGTTTTTSGGAFSGTANMTNGQSIDLVITGASARFTPTTFTSTCTSTGKAWGPRSIAAATGYVCTSSCNEPIATTLTLASTGGGGTCNAYPNDTLTYQSVFIPTVGTTLAWLGTVSFNNPRGGPAGQLYYLQTSSGAWTLSGWKSGFVPNAGIIDLVATNTCPPGGNLLVVSCSGHFIGFTLHE